MRSVQALLVAAAAAVAAAALPAGYSHTPAGAMRSECVHEVPSGAELVESDSHMVVLLDGVEHARHVKCVHTPDTPILLPAAATPGRRSLRRQLQLPADYDGWLEYTAAQDAGGYNSFLGFFSVPDTPAEFPDVLYLFTGLQNINWIPKVDPMPTADFDIIQPVLQYPAGDGSASWSVKSWYVTTKAGAYYSTDLKVAVGDNIFGNMTRLGGEQWLVNSVSSKTGQQTLIKPSNPRLKTQPWAYNTLECYGCNGCGTYPKGPSKFTNLELTCAGGRPCPPTWAANPKDDKPKECRESVDIVGPATVTINFQ